MSPRRLLLAALLSCALPAAALAYDVHGRFLYEDRLWDQHGYTGEVRNLPIRHAAVAVVDLVTGQSLATGVTDADGWYSVAVPDPPLPLPQSFYVRCAADGAPAGYHLRVVDDFVRIPLGGVVYTASRTYAITTDTTVAHLSGDVDAGTYLIQDPDGLGVAQAFNILDCGMDMFEWLASPEMNGALPTAAQSLTYAWTPVTGPPGNAGGGSNYSQQSIYIGADTTDTDGWSDTVIMHETGHWLDDVFSRTDNPGGPHFLGDNNANVRLAYGEGSATFHCAKAREYRAFHRTDLSGAPLDDHVSIYSDLMLPPPVGTAGGLSFAYDFESGTFDDGSPIGQRGTANETNVTSALWDLVDGATSPDETPGLDDDPVDVSDAYAWHVEHDWLPTIPAHITVEDYYQGWFALNGATFQKPGVDSIFVGLSRMPWFADGAEPDNTVAAARPLVPLAHTAVGTHVVINEIDVGAQDAVELYNATPAPVDLTGWQLQVYVNDDTQQPVARIYVFAPITIQPGDALALFERGDETLNGRYHLYAGTTNPQAWNASWDATVDGACVLRDAAGTVIDFVKWRGPNGDSNTPVPAGTAFTGTLLAPPANDLHLARDVSGTDTDAASDWTVQPTTLASANHDAPVFRTLFGTGDADVYAFTAEAGARYGFEARGPFSATDPRVELLSPSGGALGSNSDVDPEVRDARLDFVAPASGTYYVRVTHEGEDTDWGEYDLLAFRHPAGAATSGPAGLSAIAAHTSDTADEVDLQWLNGSVSDSVRIYRDSVLVATLPGDATTYVDHAPRALWHYEVAGVDGGTESARAAAWEFAGAVTCHAGDDFESGNTAYWITEGSSWGVTPIAASGTWAFTDSPAGTYEGCATGTAGCTAEAIATFGVPVRLPAGSTLEYDQICATEAELDHCIVEVSVDRGGSWTELARFDMSSDPAWGSGVADPTAYRHASLDLSPFANQLVQVRFRLESDALLEFDGWYVDNVTINDASCTPVLAVEPRPAAPLAFRLLPPQPNPSRGATRFAFTLPRSEQVTMAIYDAQGREVRRAALGALAPGEHVWAWDGRDGRGGKAGPGMFFARLEAGRVTLTQKALVIGR